MNNMDLDNILRSLSVPERSSDYWNNFPTSVTQQLAKGHHYPVSRPQSPRSPLLLWGILATTCIVIAFTMGWWQGRKCGLQEVQAKAMQIYFQEIEALFPQQLSAMIIDEHGPHLILSDKPDVPKSPPVFLQIKGRTGLQKILTFSGQRFPVNGDVCDVLADAEGNILLVGNKILWASNQRIQPSSSSAYCITARILGQTL